jgi:hypothetical protein
MSQDFEFNKDGFKLSYQRYLSDGVTGLLFISFFIVAFMNEWALPIVGSDWLRIFSQPAKTDVPMIAFFIFLFLMAPSIGVILTASSWFLLGTPCILLMWIWGKLPRAKGGFLINWLVSGTDRAYNAGKIIEFFKVDRSPVSFLGNNGAAKTNRGNKSGIGRSLYEVSSGFKHILIFNFPTYYASQIGYVKGVSRFLRTMALFFILLAIYFGPLNYLNLRRESSYGFLSLFFAIFFLLFSSLNEYFHSIKVLFMVHSLVINKFKGSIPKNENEIVEALVEIGVKE